MSALRKLIRLLCLRAHRSDVPTSFVPLSELRSVAVFVDDSDPGCEPARLSIRKFFGDRGMEISVISASDRDIRTSSDLFIALNTKGSIDERYAAASSRARFKIGRHGLRNSPYDFVLSDPEEGPASVGDAFDANARLLTSVK